jgi:hypothetical protein
MLQPSPEQPHSFEYRLHYGSVDGRSVLRYDNETGKGDHRHLGGREEPYQFRGVEALVGDFLRDIDEVRGGATHEEAASVSIKGARESAKEFVEAWQRGDQGQARRTAD